MKPKIILQIAVILQLVFASISIFLAYKFLQIPAGRGEFSALKNLSDDLFGLLAILFGILLLIFSYPLFKAKKWAYILSILFIIFEMSVIGVKSINALVFKISGANTLSVTSEILPSLLLVLLLLSFKNFKKQI